MMEKVRLEIMETVRLGDGDNRDSAVGDDGDGAVGDGAVGDDGVGDDGDKESEGVLDDYLSFLDKCRNDATKGQERSRSEMLRTTRAQLQPLLINDSVLVPVSEFDRGRLDCRNIPGMVLAVRDDTYKIRTQHGVLNNWLSRNQLIKADYPIIARDMVKDVVLPFRRIATLHSQHGGQGFTKCACQGACVTKRCLCLKNKRKCHSHCHAQNKLCKNK